MTAIHKPTTINDACALVTEARQSRKILSCTGNGSKSAIGQIHDQHVTSISSAGLTGINQYNPQELVFVAKAGTLLSEIEAALDDSGQRLAFEPANWSGLAGARADQTIGGIAATNMSGPRRFVAGAARDSLLGIKFINGRGEEIKNGGQVMKNVTGLDLVKLLCGSWGTLGLITEVSFKVLPKAETEKTLAIIGLSDADAASVMAKAMATSCEVTGAGHLVDATSIGMSEATTLLRLEGLEGSVRDRMIRLKSALGSVDEMVEIDVDQSAEIWRAIRDVQPFCDGSQTPIWRISVPPMEGHKVVEAARRVSACDALYDWQGGLVWLRLDDGDEAQAHVIRTAIAAHGGGHATLIRASEAQRRTVPVFQPEPLPIQALNTRIRAAIDPDGVFDAGRMQTPSSQRAA